MDENKLRDFFGIDENGLTELLIFLLGDNLNNLWPLTETIAQIIAKLKSIGCADFVFRC
jgi:hypothetical protein